MPTSWIYKLSKSQLIEKLQQAASVDGDLVFKENDSIDTLRRVLARHVRDQGSAKMTANGRESDNTEKHSKGKATHTMANDNNSKLEFHLGKDDWETYTERLKLYFLANDVENAKKVPVLLTKISAKAYKLIRDLCAPDKPITKTYEQLIKLMSNHLCPKPSEAMERCKFHQAQQAATESIAEFAARLKRLSINCGFKDAATALRDQLVCGIKDHATKILLFREEGLTYDKAYKIATAAEEAERNATSTDKLNTATAAQTNVNTICTVAKPNWNYGKQRNNYRGKQGHGNAKHANGNTGPSSQSSTGSRNCYCCGKANHWARDCFHRHKTCTSCNKKGHLATQCRRKKEDVQHVDVGAEKDKGTYDFLNLELGGNSEESTCGTIESSGDKVIAEPMYVNVAINGKSVNMEIDTGTYASIISRENKNKLLPTLEVKKLSKTLNAYDQTPLSHEGILQDLVVKLGKKEVKANMIVMSRAGPTLIGRQWLKLLGLWPLAIKSELVSERVIHKMDVANVRNEFVRQHPTLFGPGLGVYNKGMLKLVLKEGAKPVALKARRLPFALNEKVETEINRLVKLGHLEKIEVSEWATPIVPVIKNDGSVRICGNFKLTINPWLIIDRHPLPLIDEIFAALRNGKTYSQIDLTHAYMQIPVEESSRNYLAIITHKGLYRYTKLTEGIASGPGDFQRKIEQCLAGVRGAIPYLDNIFCTGETDEEHLQTLKEVFDRLGSCGFKVNIKKCDFFKEKLDILGFVIDRNGLHKSITKVKAMSEAPKPQNLKQLQSFIGLVTYYARFLPDRAEMLKPLYECVKGSKFEWTKSCDKAFEWVKTELTSSKVLAHYDPKEEIILACDASAYGLSAILSHKYADGIEKPIAYASKVISDGELHRAPIDKEASAIIFGFKKFYNYIYGKHIVLRTDHKPLVYIFGPKQEIPLTVASRLQRWAYFLSRFSYKVEYIRSAQNGNCDALSRLPISDVMPVFENEYTAINYVQENIETLNAVEIARETKRDKTLSQISKYINDMWPKELNESEEKYFTKRDKLIIEKGCIMWGYRVVIPERMRESVLRELHASHFGTVKMKMLARSYMWWPNIDRDIELVTAACSVCAQERKKPANVPLTPWPWPDKACSRIHCDFLGPFHGHMFMLIIDAHSKWPEIVDMNNCTQVPKVLAEFKMLGRFGLPRHLVTDNGIQFTSVEFREFMRKNGIKQSFSAPHHPATNGAAENFVGTFKNKVEKMVKSGKTLEYAINLFLFDYRSTEHCTTGRTPAWMMYKRELRTRFDLLKPDATDNIENKHIAQIAARKGHRNVTFQIGEEVMVDDFSVRNKKRSRGKIIKQLSPVTFEVEISPNCTWKRHVDQIIKIRGTDELIDGTDAGRAAAEQQMCVRRSARLKGKVNTS
ncbi:uncharacterized protein K02A2.6-like [Nylanderia fulva]|uniref:uncharacterized protein K02A2.6-like n=1 Tax=Nylanderia fulva TaxID=613905 RepID=UPI0010FB639D|nr:uncharacterized protein K02A2.6-like [Nylanderia fulva]XP_029162126.1 uncharacterized protein K02A2.6-like [Nylanderia fulva]